MEDIQEDYDWFKIEGKDIVDIFNRDIFVLPYDIRDKAVKECIIETDIKRFYIISRSLMNISCFYYYYREEGLITSDISLIPIYRQGKKNLQNEAIEKDLSSYIVNYDMLLKLSKHLSTL